MGNSPYLPLDPDFSDFNFSTIHDPGLQPGLGPDSRRLYQLVYLGRQGDTFAALAFADVIYWTLQEGSFEAFKWKHGPRPITYQDWFYAKLTQFLEILLYERLIVDHMYSPETDRPWEEGESLTGKSPFISLNDLEAAISPEEAKESRSEWDVLAVNLSEAGKKRFSRFQSWLKKRIAQRQKAEGSEKADDQRKVQPKPKRLRRSKQDERNILVASFRRQGRDSFEICRALDRKGFATTPMMQKHRLLSWLDAWEDPDFRNNVEQVISKAASRFPDVG